MNLDAWQANALGAGIPVRPRVSEVKVYCPAAQGVDAGQLSCSHQDCSAALRTLENGRATPPSIALSKVSVPAPRCSS
jgi:hypothetical protein